MKAYLLLEEEPCFCESVSAVIGVFSSYEKASEVAKIIADKKNHNSSWYTIDEYELDGEYIDSHIAFEENE